MQEHHDSETPRLASDVWPRVSLFSDALAVADVRGLVDRLVTARGDQGWFRVWVPGCGGGELVYAIAAVVREAVDHAVAPLRPRIFGTDHDTHALRRARAGWYPQAIADKIAATGLAHHFVADEAGYQASSSLRNMCVFAPHDLVRDPPLHGVDVVVCGDLPGVLDPDIGLHLAQTFRFALREGGLFLVDPALNLADGLHFDAVLPEIGVFRARADAPPRARLPEIAASSEPTFGMHRLEDIAATNDEVVYANEDLTLVNHELQTKLEEIELLRSDLDNLLRTTRIPTLFLDPQLRIRWFSPSAAEVLRVRDTDIGRPLAGIRARVSGADLLAEATAVLHDGIPREVPVERAASNDHYRVRLLPYRRSTVGLEGVVLTFVDVTEIELATRALERQAEQQRAIARLGMLALERPSEVLFERTVQELQRTLRISACEILSLDPLAEKLTVQASVGWPRPSLVEDAGVSTAASWELAERAPSLSPASAQHLVDAGITRTLSTSIRDESSVYGLLRAHAVDAGAFGPDEIAFISSVASILGNAVGRQRALALLREQQQHKDDFLAMLGHELRNPLAAVSSAVEIQQLVPSENPLLHKSSAVIGRQVKQMVRIIDDLLDVSRLVRGKLWLERQPVDFGGLVRSVVEDNGPLARSGLELELLMSAQPIVVVGDRERLAQVLNNLISNAVRFTQAPGTITVTLKASDDTVELRVQDTGCGIAPEFLAHLFEPFRQAPQNLARQSGGLGLGLAVVEQIVVRHGGSVHAHSAGPGRGATFTVRLPRADVEPGREAPPPAMVAALRILVVEDNEDSAEVLAHMLELVGHEVTIARDAHEGLQAAEERELDVVLCDIGLPGEIDGYRFAETMRDREEPHPPALISISGYGRPEDTERARLAGFEHHLTKPVDLAALQRVIGNVLEHRSTAR